MRNILLFLFTSAFLNVNAQNYDSYLRKHAVLIDKPEKLSDSIYNMLTPFQIIMFGEMHGTNESAPFIEGLAELFTSKGDSIQVGLEIAPSLMNTFLLLHTDSSIYQSKFFDDPPYLDGKESLPWASLISNLNKNPRVRIFFLDTDKDNEVYSRDSLMAAEIKRCFNSLPSWRIITLSGNYHNRITEASSMTSVLKRNLPVNICSVNMEYKEGTCNANFGHGLEIKQLESYPSVFNSTVGYERYFLLLPKTLPYDYNGFYYTKYISAAKMSVQN